MSRQPAQLKTKFLSLTEVYEADLLERAGQKLSPATNLFVFKIKPHEIKTFLLR